MLRRPALARRRPGGGVPVLPGRQQPQHAEAAATRSCGTRRAWSRCGSLVTLDAQAASGVPGGVMGTRAAR
jgi:hypothetical protein